MKLPIIVESMLLRRLAYVLLILSPLLWGLFIFPVHGQTETGPTPPELTPNLRARFLPENLRQFADTGLFLPVPQDGAVPTEDFLVRCSELLGINPETTVLIVGRATGYAAAILAAKAERVYVVELAAGLLENYGNIWRELGLDNIETAGLESIPNLPGLEGFDAVLVHGVTEKLPPRITALVSPGGSLLVPLLDAQGVQEMVLLVRRNEGWELSPAGLAFFPARPISFED